MDRFIATKLNPKYSRLLHLKSNMDRFIVVTIKIEIRQTQI